MVRRMKGFRCSRDPRAHSEVRGQRFSNLIQEKLLRRDQTKRLHTANFGFLRHVYYKFYTF
jgi:hypothetical protein